MDKTIVLNITKEDLGSYDPRCRLPTKNSHLKMVYNRSSKGWRIVRTKRAIGFVELLGRKLGSLVNSFLEGFWELKIVVFAPTRSRKLGGDSGNLDADACLVPVRDALQLCGVVDNDMRLLCGPVEVIYRMNNPGIVIQLTKVHDRGDWRKHHFGDLIDEYL